MFVVARSQKNYLDTACGIKAVSIHCRKPTTVSKHTGPKESDASAESENEDSSSDNPSDNNTSSVSKGMNDGGTYCT